MKRVFIGVVALMFLGAIGSAVVIFAKRSLAPAEEAEGEQTAFISPRDVSPSPIPLEQAADEPVASDPFATRTREPARATREPAGRWGDAQSLAQAEPEEPRYAPTRRVVTLDAQAPQATDEEMPATRVADPFGSRPRTASSRYAEQPAAAELSLQSDPSPNDLVAPDNEPRRLESPTGDAEFDRYGRRLNAPTATRDPYREDPRADEPKKVEPTFDRGRPALNPWPASDSQLDSDQGTGRPGDPKLSGSQSPTLTIEKLAPAEIQIGKPAKFVIKVRNVGSVPAQGVEVHDTIPQGTQLLETRPAAKRAPQGGLVWDLGAMRPGDEATAELQLMPLAEGEVGSVATVHFRAEASVRTLATKPMLTIEVQGPNKVMKGDDLTLRIKLSNPGSGAATGVVLSEEVPQGLAHPAGSQLEFDVGTLKPGESRFLELGLKAVEAGTVSNRIVAQGEANLRVEATSDLEVVAPQLAVSLAGPKRRYLERNATHNISVSNPGTASAKDIELVAVLPRELKFVEANNGGHFDAATHSVYWSLEELPPQETGTVSLTTLPLRPGDARLVIKSTAQAGLSDQHEEVLAIEGMAAINFQLSDVSDPIEVGGQTTYEIRVTNQGSKAATNLLVVALLPRELKALSAEGPVRYRVEGQRVVFEPLKQLAPKADTVFTIKVQAVDSGDLRLQVQIATDEIRDPITKEESTRVFGDDEVVIVGWCYLS